MYAATLAILLLLIVAFRRGVRSRLLAVAALLLFSQILLGALNVWLGEHATLIVAHLVTATLLWSTPAADRLPLRPRPCAGGRAGRRQSPRPQSATAAA